MMLRLVFLKLLPLAAATYGIEEGARHGTDFAKQLIAQATGSMAQYELGAVARAVSAECVGGPLKIRPDQFPQWLRETIGTEKGAARSVEMDRFGHPYDLLLRSRQVFVRSRGPDGVAETKDDIIAEVPCSS